MNDSLSALLKTAGTGALQTFGNVLAQGAQTTRGADTEAVAQRSKWDWRMVGLVGVVVVGLVLLIRFRR